MFVLLHVRHVRSVSRSENERFVQHVLIVLSWALLSPRPCPPDASTPGYLSELTSHCVLHLFFFSSSLFLFLLFIATYSPLSLSSACDLLFIFLLLRPLCPPSIPPSSTSIPAIAVLFLPSSSSLPSPFSSSSLHHPPATPSGPRPPLH